MLESAEGNLKAAHFRDRELMLDVLNSYLKATKTPLNYRKKAYILLWVKEDGQIRISVSDEVVESSTVYSVDQFVTLANTVAF